VQTADQNGLHRKPRSDLLDSEDEEFFFSGTFKDSNNIKISYEDYIKQRSWLDKEAVSAVSWNKNYLLSNCRCEF
jgi:hypothetical protein